MFVCNVEIWSYKLYSVSEIKSGSLIAQINEYYDNDNLCCLLR